jgi:hypothetical protein
LGQIAILTERKEDWVDGGKDGGGKKGSMNGWKEGRMYGWKDGGREGWMEVRINGGTGQIITVLTERKETGRKDGWREGWW